MTKNDFLDAVVVFTKDLFRDVQLPCNRQTADEEQLYRAPEVHKMRLPDSGEYKKKVPYIIQQIVTQTDQDVVQRTGEGKPVSLVTLRTIFCVYALDESEGALSVMELCERYRIALLTTRVLDGKYRLDVKDNAVETMIYPDAVAPYFAAEMMSVWKMPTVTRWDKEIR